MTSPDSRMPFSLPLSLFHCPSFRSAASLYVDLPPSLLLLLAFLSSQALLLTVPGIYHLSLRKNENKRGSFFYCFTHANGG